MYDFKFADIGEGIHEGKILEWKFKVGDKVNEGDTLVIVETDKVNAELPSPVSGVVVELGKKEGDIINVGETVVIIDDGSSTTVKKEQEKAPKEKKEEKEAGATVIGEIEVSSDLIESSSEHNVKEEKRIKALATPVARNYAKTLNIDINEVTGTGRFGRVLKEDIDKFKNAGATPQIEIPKVNISKEGDVRIEELTSIRKAISKAMTASKRIIPETILFDEVVVDKLVDLRNRVKITASEQGISLTYLSFIAKAVIIALREFPIFNSSYDHENEQIIYKNFINLGFAVDTPTGLIVPNIKNANHLSVFDFARHIKDLALRAIDRKTQLDEIQNGTFSITNFGSVGVPFGTPIINYPEVAILGIGRINKKPIVVDDEIKVGYVLPLSLAVDHRIIDGADAGGFLQRIKQLLNEPELIMLG